MQETNTWSLLPCTMDDFRSQGLVAGAAVEDEFSQTGTELGGAFRALRESGAVAVPLLRAYAHASGRVTRTTLAELSGLLVEQLGRTPIDGLVLSLHGAMAGDDADDADAELLHTARTVLGPQMPIGVCLDLHANITRAMVQESDFLTGYHTYPHTDLAETGARTARLVLAALQGQLQPITVMAKRPMIVPAETMSTASGPLASLRRRADELTTGSVLDVSLFPVQPWLDVDELGFTVTVTTDGDPVQGRQIAEFLADCAWERRTEFEVELYSPADAIDLARTSHVRPFLISESADAPTAGGAGDSPAMVRALLEHGPDLHAYVTVTDPAAVTRCAQAGLGADVQLMVGAGLDPRFHAPVSLTGTVERLDDRPVLLTGPSYTGTEVSMGAFAVVRSGQLFVLLSERPAFTLDPATFVHAGLDPQVADVVVVRSANGFRAAFPAHSVAAAALLDLPGASTPRLDYLDFTRAPRPMYPLDADVGHPLVLHDG